MSAGCTTPAPLAGLWRLTGFAEETGEAGLIGEESDQRDIDEWLNGGGGGRSIATVADTRSARGLALHVAPDCTFDERRTGTAALPWFDASGVLEAEATPFAGTLFPAGEAAYLRPATINSWAQPVDGRHGAARLRYDDGDTKIADRIERLGVGLTRIVNVVTDELYFNRVLLIYERDAG